MFTKQAINDGACPDQRKQVDDCAKAVPKHMPVEAGQNVRTGVERGGGGKKVSREKEWSAQGSLAVKNVIVQHVKRRAGEGNPNRKTQQQRQSHNQPKLPVSFLRRVFGERDQNIPGSQRSDDRKRPSDTGIWH